MNDAKNVTDMCNFIAGWAYEVIMLVIIGELDPVSAKLAIDEAEDILFHANIPAPQVPQLN